MKEGGGGLLCESVWDEKLTLQTPITRRVAYEVQIYIYICIFLIFEPYSRLIERALLQHNGYIKESPYKYITKCNSLLYILFF